MFQGKVDKADSLILRATEILEKTLGPDNPGLSQTLGTRASLFVKQASHQIVFLRCAVGGVL